MGRVKYSFHGGEVGLEFLGFFAFLLPPRSDGFVLGEELDGSLSVEVGSAEEAVLVASEGKHRQGHGDGQVDADLASLDFVLELPGGVAILGKDGGSVSVVVVVDQVYGLL